MSMDVVKVMRSLTKSWNGSQGSIEPADDVFSPGGNVQKTGIFPLDSRSGERASPSEEPVLRKLAPSLLGRDLTANRLDNKSNRASGDRKKST
jgi:hypothetical protein